MTATDGNGVTRTTTLDSLGRIAGLTYANAAGATVDGFGYAYDQDGNVLSRTNTVVPGQSELYSYDGLNRLTGFTRGTLNGSGTAVSGTPTGTESWQFDALGNWQANTLNGVTTSRTNNAQNQIKTVTTPAAGGANVTATLGYDADGNTLVDAAGQRYTYDAWNRVTRVIPANGGPAVTFAYDAQGRRVTETRTVAVPNTRPAQARVVVTALYYGKGWQVIEERQDGTPTAQYVWDGTDRLIARDDHDPATAGTALDRRLYAQQDADGNVTSLTDASGTVVERYVYDPYGAVTVLNPDGSVRGNGTASAGQYGWAYLHQGLRLDVASGTYDDRNRVYDPASGRFLQPDPAGYVDGANKYMFTLDNPVAFDDPSGLASTPENPPGVSGGLPPSDTGGIETTFVGGYNISRYLWGSVVNTVQALGGDDLGSPTSGRITVSIGPETYYARLLRNSSNFRSGRYQLLQKLKARLNATPSKTSCPAKPAHIADMTNIPGAVYEDGKMAHNLGGQTTIGRYVVTAQALGQLGPSPSGGQQYNVAITYTMSDTFHLHLATGLGLDSVWEPGSFENFATWSETVVIPVQ